MWLLERPTNTRSELNQFENKKGVRENTYFEDIGTATLIRGRAAFGGLEEICLGSLGSFSAELSASVREHLELRVARPKAVGC